MIKKNIQQRLKSLSKFLNKWHDDGWKSVRMLRFSFYEYNNIFFTDVYNYLCNIKENKW